MVAYPNLRAEMARYMVSAKSIAEAIGITPQAFSSKIQHKTQFTIDEAFAIRDKFFPRVLVDVLFSQKEIPSNNVLFYTSRE